MVWKLWWYVDKWDSSNLVHDFKSPCLDWCKSVLPLSIPNLHAIISSWAFCSAVSTHSFNFFPLFLRIPYRVYTHCLWYKQFLENTHFPQSTMCACLLIIICIAASTSSPMRYTQTRYIRKCLTSMHFWTNQSSLCNLYAKSPIIVT